MSEQELRDLAIRLSWALDQALASIDEDAVYQSWSEASVAEWERWCALNMEAANLFRNEGVSHVP